MWQTLGCAKCVALLWSQCDLRWLLGSLDSWPQGALRLLHDEVVVFRCDDVGVVLGVSPMPEPVCSAGSLVSHWGSVLGGQVLGSFPQGALCPGDVLCNGVVLGVSLGPL